MGKRALFLLSVYLVFRLGTAAAIDDSLPPPPDSEGGSDDDLPAAEEMQSDLEPRSSSPTIKLRLRLSLFLPSLDKTPFLLGQPYLMESLTLSRDCVVGHLTIEKDQGETSPADFVAGYIDIKLRDTGRLVLGDYRPGYGQGLVFSRWSRNVFSPNISARKDASSPGFTSTGENSALRGALATATTGVLQVSLMVSDNEFDASLDADGLIEARRETGLHVTAGERKAMDAQRERLAGMHCRIGRGSAGFGASALLAKLSPPFATSGSHAGRCGPNGDRAAIAGVDWNTDAALPVQLFGECAYGGQGRCALITGAILRRRTTDARLLLRYYAPGYWSPYGAGVSASGDNENEAGLLARMRWRPGRSSVLGVWVDTYRRPADLPSGRYATSAGSRFGLYGECHPGGGTTASAALGVRSSQGGRPRRSDFLRASTVGDLKWAPSERYAASVHLEFTHAKRIFEEPASGSNVRFGLRISPRGPYLFEWRTSRFAIDSYDARITEVDYGAPYAPAPDILTSAGVKHHLRISHQGRRLTWSASYRFRQPLSRSRSRLFVQTDAFLDGDP